ncbi:MAG: NADH-quinone oxidoreductase subunit C [Planctomycetaceae bacterium]|nr:MAG: NADH-quinone oxidoreductase subunit C [Planctomycetaceae bacterium]
MQLEEIYQRLLERFGAEVVLSCQPQSKDPWIEIAPQAIKHVCLFLRDEPALQFDALNNLCGSDWMETDPKKKNPVEPHLEVVYHLYSYTHKHHVKLKLKLPRWRDGVVGRLPQVPSVAEVWPIADWHEREAYDLVGIEFTGHPHLRRILCPEDWVGHPLRKDYEFPLEYHGIRGR